MKKLFYIFALFLSIVIVSAQLSNIPIGKMPIAPTLKPTAWVPIIQPYDGRTTNDNFRISSTNLGTVFGTNAPINTIVVTNLIVVSNLVYLGMTNGLDLWTNIGGVYTPTEAQTRLLANGITSANFLLTTGSLSDTPTTNALLALGPNNVSVFQQGSVWIPSPSTDPSTVEVRLSAGNGNGNYLSLWNAGPDGNGFTIFNGSALYNAPGNFLHLHGNWVTTNLGDGLLLKGGGTGWYEVGRAYGNTNFVSGDSLWGNTNLVTFLKPEFGATVRWGNSSSNWVAGPSDGLVVLHDSSTTNGDGTLESDFNNFLFGATDNSLSPTNQSWFAVLQGSGLYAGAQLWMLSATNYQDPMAPISDYNVTIDPINGVATMRLYNNGVTNFYVASDSGYEGAGLRMLANDGTYWPNDTNTTAGLWIVDTNNVLQPIDLTWQPMVPSWLVGTNAFSFYGAANSGEALVGVSQVDAGDPNYRSIFIVTSKTGSQSDASGYFNEETYTNRVILSQTVTSNSVPSSFSMDINHAINQMRQAWTYQGIITTTLEPTVADGAGAMAYTLDTFNALTDGTARLVAIRNQTTNQLSFGPLAQIWFGNGGTNVLYRNGSDLVYTNGDTDVKFTVLDGTANGPSLEAQGTAAVLSTSGGATAVTLRAVTDQVTLSSGSFFPTVDLSENNGRIQNAWLSTVTSNLTVRGFVDGTLNYAKAVINVTGTNSTDTVQFLSTSAGTAGTAARPFQFTNAPVMMPYVTKVEKTALSAIDGMIVYQTDNTPGMRVYVGGTWYIVSTAADP